MEELVAVYNKYGRKINSRPISRSINNLIIRFWSGGYTNAEKIAQHIGDIGYTSVIDDICSNRAIYMHVADKHKCVLQYTVSMNVLNMLKSGYIISIDRDADYNKIIRGAYGHDKVYNIPNAEYVLAIVATNIRNDFELLTILKGVSECLKDLIVREYPMLKDIVYVSGSSRLIRHRLDGYKLFAIYKEDIYTPADMNNIVDHDVFIYTKGESIIACMAYTLSDENISNICEYGLCMKPLDYQWFDYYDDYHNDEYIRVNASLYESRYAYKLGYDMIALTKVCKGNEYTIKKELAQGKIVLIDGYSSIDEFLHCIGNARCVFDYLDSYTSAMDLLHDIAHMDLKCLKQILPSDDPDKIQDLVNSSGYMPPNVMQYIMKHLCLHAPLFNDMKCHGFKASYRRDTIVLSRQDIYIP